MKIVVPGRDPQAVAPWWGAVQIRCAACATVVALEPGDDVATVVERRPGGTHTATISCPACGGRAGYASWLSGAGDWTNATRWAD